MHFSQVSLLALSACISASVASPTGAPNSDLSTKSLPRMGALAINKPKFLKRGEPKTGEDDFPDTGSHPNELDKVETAFNDAIELANFVRIFIDTDVDIYPHYFANGDREEIKRIFTSISNNLVGNDFLDNIFVQKNDIARSCDGRTIAYSLDFNTDHPFIVLCPIALKKKAVGMLKGKSFGDADAKNFYASCKDNGGDIDQNVSYFMNTLGMTLLHEYMHMDEMIDSAFGPIVDKRNGYGPVNVYDKLAKNQARNNADSYAYYASHLLWTKLCKHTFQAPRAGIDDEDPDCGGVCQP